MAGPTVEFWQSRFVEQSTPWDRGEAGPLLKGWLASDLIAGQTVLVPGCGSGWEVVACARAGLQTIGIDYAPAAVARTRARLYDAALTAEVVEADVLAWRPPQPVDAVYEQTCMCALHPDHWLRYAAQLHDWLKPGGRLFAMWMQKPRPGAAEGRIEGPPYHCDIHAMRALLPDARWAWPKPPYSRVPHPSDAFELGVVLIRR